MSDIKIDESETATAAAARYGFRVTAEHDTPATLFRVYLDDDAFPRLVGTKRLEDFYPAARWIAGEIGAKVDQIAALLYVCMIEATPQTPPPAAAPAGPKIRNISTAETAKIVRRVLKNKFPGVKFTVRSSKSGGTISVFWEDGPAFEHVRAICDGYRGYRFDGQIDMGCYVEHWMMPDFSTAIAHTDGTTGSLGGIEPVREWMPDPEAVRVQFSVRFINCDRDYSEKAFNAAFDHARSLGHDVTAENYKYLPYNSAFISVQEFLAETDF